MHPIVPYAGNVTKWNTAADDGRQELLAYMGVAPCLAQPIWQNAISRDLPDDDVAFSPTLIDSLMTMTQFQPADTDLFQWYATHTVAISAGWDISLPSLTLVERQHALQLIEAMKSLAENWDGFGAASIPNRISQTASSIVSSLPDYIPTPVISANSNGTISLEWQNDVGRAHLEIGSENFSCYVRRWHGQTLYRDGYVDEINSSKSSLLQTLYSVRPTQDYTISDIYLAEAT